MTLLTASMILLGSWIGVAYVGCLAVPKIVRSLLTNDPAHHRHAELDAEGAVRDAAREAVAETSIGQGLREFVGYTVDPEHLTIAA